MESLSENWITENLMDFEYKKYVLLGYLKRVKAHFSEQKLYPDFAELIAHYKNLLRLKQNTSQLETNFRKKLKGINYTDLSLVYENTVNDELLHELKQIIEFSEPLIANELYNGRSIFDFAEQHILSDHVGIIPLYKQEGYFILQPFKESRISVYYYHFSNINLSQEHAYGLSSSYVSDYTISLSLPVDYIKYELIKANPQLPNPAVYLFKASALLPGQETFLPIAKRLLYKQLLGTV